MSRNKKWMSFWWFLLEKGGIKIMNYHTITYPDQNNGDGLRVVLWLSGCSHHCKGCQNPQTWDTNSGIKFDDNAFSELFDELEKDYISGLTLTGGDPMFENNLSQVYNICSFAKRILPQKTIWIYTGYTWEELNSVYGYNVYKNDERQLILKYCDVLVDGRFEEELKDITLPWRGSSNQRVIDVQKSLKEGKVILHCK